MDLAPTGSGPTSVFVELTYKEADEGVQLVDL